MWQEQEFDLKSNYDRKWLVNFNARKTQLVSFDQSNNTCAIYVKTNGSVLEEKSSFKMLWLTFSFKLDWGSIIISIAKSAFKKIGHLILSMKFLSPEAALLLQNQICRTIGPSFAASYEVLVYHRNVASLNLFYRYYFGRWSSKLAKLVLLSFSWVRSTIYSDRLDDFPATIARCYTDVYVTSFFSRTARLWNSLPTECLALTYDLSGF